MRTYIITTVIAAALIIALPLLSAAERTGEQVYKTKCFACHDSGAGGAPKIGDAAAWKPHIKEGMDALAAVVKKGAGIMPPMGGCTDCTDAELKATIKFMIDKSK